MARVLYKSGETYLKCPACDTIFRHNESRCISDQIWEAPCCTRRYQLEISEDLIYVLTLGWGSKKRRDESTNPLGIEIGKIS